MVSNTKKKVPKTSIFTKFWASTMHMTVYIVWLYYTSKVTLPIVRKCLVKVTYPSTLQDLSGFLSKTLSTLKDYFCTVEATDFTPIMKDIFSFLSFTFQQTYTGMIEKLRPPEFVSHSDWAQCREGMGKQWHGPRSPRPLKNRLGPQIFCVGGPTGP